MASKLLTLTAAAAGYVLGARAGRERYETIKSKADKFMGDPRVRKAASDAQDFAAEKAPAAGQKAKDVAGKAKSKVTSGNDDSNGEKSPSPTGAATKPSSGTPASAPSQPAPGGTAGTGAGSGTAGKHA